jgi:hypothetical protein
MNTIYYDLESDSEHPQYANMSLFGALECDEQGNEVDLRVWEAPFTEEKIAEISSFLCRDDVIRVGFNNLNYDDLLSANYGINIPEENTHDAMLAIKTCHPGLPAHGCKFLNWFLLGDPHWPEFELKQSGHRFGNLVDDKLRAYHRWDLYQHKNLWEYIYPIVTKDEHWEAYCIDMAMKFPLQEMTYDGGTLVDVEKCKTTLADLELRKEVIQREVQELSGGKIKNANSNRQVGKYLAQIEDYVFDLTATGEFQVKKKDLVDIVGMTEENMRGWNPGNPLPDGISEIALLAWQMRDNETIRKYVHNYLEAALGTSLGGWIPNSYSISRAATRRTLSKSFYKINFQNSTESIDEFMLVPPGCIGWWIDSTQVENVVHIYESNDVARRRAYEADEEWNEYVWLCNRILGGDKSKKELEAIKSKRIPHWSVYKEFKTAKLSLNFGQGARAFSDKLGLELQKGKEIFSDIHVACPAIRQLQDKVERNLNAYGYVQDTFGHIYQGLEAYKVVAYLVQGCGTGSLPKAQIRANYETLHKWSDQLGQNVGYLCKTTHDESSGFLRLDIGHDNIEAILCELMENMTSKFSPKFDDIPLRAKLYLSVTNAADKKKYETKNYKQSITYPDAYSCR